MKRSMVALAAMMSMALGGTACGPAPTSEETQAPASETNSTGDVRAMACGDYGWWTCSTDGEQFDYEAAGCGTPAYWYKPAALDRCNAYCPGTCTDSGWHSGGGL